MLWMPRVCSCSVGSDNVGRNGGSAELKISVLEECIGKGAKSTQRGVFGCRLG